MIFKEKVSARSMVYRPNEGNPRLHGWTRKYHRAFVKGADGAWVEEK